MYIFNKRKYFLIYFIKLLNINHSLNNQNGISRRATSAKVCKLTSVFDEVRSININNLLSTNAF